VPQGTTHSARIHEPAEVVIVGSGMAGSTLAVELARAGFDVLTLEAGPERCVADMVSSQIWSRRLRWAGAPIEGEGDLTGALTFGMGWGTGGAGLHWYGNWYRFQENDFKERSVWGPGLDWPIEYGDLQGAYDRAEREFGVSGDRAREPWGPPADAYPMPPLQELLQTRVLRKGFEARGLRTAPNSQAINSRAFQGRVACILDGWCDAGCPIGALANPLVLQWPKAFAAGVRLRNDSEVTRVTTDAAGRRVTGVEYRDASGGAHLQPAGLVIVACHTIPNVRLLLLSANAAHPNGLANRSGLLGRHFMSHPSISVFGLFDQPTQPHLGLSGGNLVSRDGYDDKRPGPGAFGSRCWVAGQAAKPNGLLGIAVTRPDLYGTALQDFLHRATRHFGQMTAFCEETSLAENRVELSTTSRDRHGLPAARVINRLPAENAARVALARDEGLEILRAAGANEVWAGPTAAIHQVGGTVMGRSADDSVANSYGQTHEIENLFIAGASLFPTIAAVNPTGTLSALALRTADYIISERAALIA
jgi:choline dehydrogenase-like flavoprotein